MKCCYISNCDKMHADEPNRSMFTIPKNAELLAKWSSVIPQIRRPLISTDRICCKHFNPEDIESSWKHNIEGKVVTMPRARAQLKKSAVPCLLLQIPLSFVESSTRKKNKLKKIIDETIHDIEEPIIEPVEDVSKKAKIDDDKHKKETFQNLYEEVFDVTLPSELWGIHRDPQETTIAFSRLNLIESEVDLLVLIDTKWEYRVRIKGIEVDRNTLETLNSDSLTTLLDDIDNTHKY